MSDDKKVDDSEPDFTSEKIDRRLDSIEQRLKELAKGGCVWHFFYFGLLMPAFARIALEALTSVSPNDIFLYGFSIFLWLRFWLFDTIKPGLKCEQQETGKIRDGIFYSLGMNFFFWLTVLFFFGNQPLHFMAILSIVYASKAGWHSYHKNGFQKTSENFNILQLASLSDFVVAFILCIYSLIFLGNLYVFPMMSIPSFIFMDPASQSFQLSMIIFAVGTTVGLEFHYYMCEQMLKTMSAAN